MREALTISIRVAGLILIIFTISKTPVHTMAYSIRPEYGITSYLIPFIIPIIAGILLVMFPRTTSNIITRKIEVPFTLENTSILLSAALIAIGIIFLFFSISDAVFHIATAVALYLSPNYEINLSTFDVPGAATTVIELLVSLFLIFRANKIASYLYGRK